MIGYRQRLADREIPELLGELPALLIVGPRATGKTTTAIRHAGSVVRLDREADAVAFRADPDAALREYEEPVLLDEWQVVPSVLGAVKRAVDLDSSPGRYLLTGSVRADLDIETWPGTGRLVRLAMYPMTVAEQLGHDTDSLVDRLQRGERLQPGTDTPDLRGYVDLALAGGFPEPALKLGERARGRWLESYADQVVTRDVEASGHDRDPVLLGRYLEAYCLNSAGLVEEKTLMDAAGIARKTALAYGQLLENLMVTQAVPAWANNRLRRLVRAPKRFVVDASLIGGVLGVDSRAVMRDGNLLGRVIETFVVAQVRSEAALASPRVRLYHLRDQQGRHEVDLVAEVGGQRVVGIEIKATAAPSRADARHLIWLRDLMGDRFVAGVVLHTGPASFRFDDRVQAAPISTLWA